ncbi:hypothetical protein Dsin_030681 [Dipteronia sinensis]|uniref:GDSL esterase/lipase At4g10955-like n=1 Tax=Dipteronia sinensis TaxID=43782 RepID=A0AAE0DSM8_9ROSI|nr:hypothetical protein Dsin_030681 [Dipteronia sinensis]
MAKVGAEEIITTKEAENSKEFHVSGPRNVVAPNWRDLINSSWQENRTEENALAPKWWLPFRYKLIQTLMDERDGSIYGAILKWDRFAAMADLVPIRPSGAPKAVLALRGTLLKRPTIRRDIEDDLRLLAWDSLKGSVRFKGALEALKSVATRYGSNKVCVAGHSLGAGFSLQVGKALAKEGIYVETHLFNPPSVPLAMSFRNIGEKAGFAWNELKSMLQEGEKTSSGVLKNSDFYGDKTSAELKKWGPHLYINKSDYICCYYTKPDGRDANNGGKKENAVPINGQAAAKLFVISKGKQKLLEAHGLEQWWSDDLELQMSLQNSKLLNRQLRSLYS